MNHRTAFAWSVWVTPWRSAKFCAPSTETQPVDLRPSMNIPSAPETAAVSLHMKVWIAKVIPLASMPEVNLPNSAQSGVNMKSMTPRIAMGTARSIEMMMKPIIEL